MDQNNNLTDSGLVRRVLQGDKNAFGQVIKNTEGLVAQIIYKMINNNEDRRDLAQECYLKAFKYLPDFKFQSKLSTWIARIAYNACLNYLEKKKLALIGDDTALDGLRQSIKIATAPDSLEKKELSKILLSETEKLPPLYNTLITLFHREELSYAEIAEITGLPAGTLKNYLFRARKMLKDNILINYKKDEL